MHLVRHDDCIKSLACSSGGGLAILGDAGGGITVMSPSNGIVGEATISDKATTTKAVTALASFISQHGSIGILVGYSEGSLGYHILSYTTDNGYDISKYVSIPNNATSGASSWKELHAFEWHGGKHGLANIAGITRDGQVALGRIQVGDQPKIKKQISQTFQPFIDKSLGLVNDSSAFSDGDTCPNNNNASIKDAALFLKLQRTTVDVLTVGAQVTWGPLAMASRGKHALRPLMPCEGWDKYGLGIPHILHAVLDVDSPAPRVLIGLNGGRLGVVHLASTPGRPVCRIYGASEITSDGRGLNEIDAMASIPGYVVALSNTGNLHVVNISGTFLRPNLTSLLKQPFEDLSASLPPGQHTSRTAWWAASSKQQAPWWSILKTASPTEEKIRQRPLIVGGATQGFPAVPAATGLVVIQLGPQVAGLYATYFPYNKAPKFKSSGFRMNWIAALQPLIIAGALGIAIHKAKMGRRQQAAAQIFKQSRMQGMQSSGDGRAAMGNAQSLPFSLRGDAVSLNNINNSEGGGAWDDEAFPWEKREMAQKTRVAERFDANFAALMGDRKRALGKSSLRGDNGRLIAQPFVDHAPMPGPPSGLSGLSRLDSGTDSEGIDDGELLSN